MGKAPFPPCSSGRSLQSSSSVQEYARVATPENNREEGFSHRLCPLDWLWYQHTDAAFCVGCERLMPQTSYFLALHPLFLFSSHPLHLTLCSNSTQSTALMFHNTDLLTQRGEIPWLGLHCMMVRCSFSSYRRINRSLCNKQLSQSLKSLVTATGLRSKPKECK